MNTTSDAHPLQSPQYSETDGSIILPKTRHSERSSSPSSSTSNLPFRRVNASLSTLFASTATSPSRPSSSHSTAAPGPIAAAFLSPGSAQNSDVLSPLGAHADAEDDPRNLIVRSFVPHIAVYASADAEQIIASKGIGGGLLALLRPYGERVQGKVTIRDSNGASKTWEDFGVRFTGLRTGLEIPWLPNNYRNSSGGDGHEDVRSRSADPIPPRLRTGGDVPQIEYTVDRHLTYSEMQSEGLETDYLNHKEASSQASHTISAFQYLYLRRLLSGLPMTPHETFSHPIACVIAISARSPSPIEELRRLYTDTISGDRRLPQWVNNEYLRYYLLLHDEDRDDIGKSTALYEQMKRHFGLHSHLLRLRSSTCVPTDDDTARLPICQWVSAAEEIAEIRNRENSDGIEDISPCIFESDVTAINTFIREMVAQSIIPNMERDVAKWNDQVASKRRGLSGRFVSISRRWTPFGSSSRSITNPLGTSANGTSNYDPLQGFYKPDTSEAIMRKLADYAFMLRDFKFAQSTYDLLRTDFSNDKAWKYYAGANEMAAISTLLNPQTVATKIKSEAIDQMLESACYSYLTRSAAPYHALRTLALAVELLRLRGSSAADDAARWACRVLEDRLVGPTGHALFTERVAACFTARQAPGTMQNWGSRRRKSAFWSVLAADAWLQLDKSSQAKKCLDEASRLYGQRREDEPDTVPFEGMHAFLESLRDAVRAIRNAADDASISEVKETDKAGFVAEPEQEERESLGHPGHQRDSSGPIRDTSGHQRDSSSHHRESSGHIAAGDPLGLIEVVDPLSPERVASGARRIDHEGFE